MTTDEKTDSKTSEGRGSDSSQSSGSAEAQNIESKISAIDPQTDQTCTQIQTEESLEGCRHEEQDESSKVFATDIHMRNAESVENMAIDQSESSQAVALPSSSVEKAEEEKEDDDDEEVEEKISFKLIFKKNNYDININSKIKVSELKEQIQRLTSVAPSMQKLLFKGIPLNDTKTLSETGLKNGVKVMLIGSTITDVIAVTSTSKEDVKEEKAQTSAREPLCKQKQHKKVIDRGMPDDVMPAWKNGSLPLPRDPLHGMINKYNHKVRLTFKLEQDQLWVGTKERTEKLSMMSIRSVVSEPIESNPQYHIMGIQTGPTEASRIWLYWVPAQYVEAIKDTILGK